MGGCAHHISVVAIGGASEGHLLLRQQEALLDDVVEDEAAGDGDGGDDGRPDHLLDGEHEGENELRDDEACHHLPVHDRPHLHREHAVRLGFKNLKI